jgi:uncharacterized protein YxeA
MKNMNIAKNIGMKKVVSVIFSTVFLISCATYKFTPPNDGKMYVFVNPHRVYKNGEVVELGKKDKSSIFCDKEAIKKFEEASEKYTEAEALSVASSIAYLIFIIPGLILSTVATEKYNEAYTLFFEAVNIHNDNPMCTVGKEK